MKITLLSTSDQAVGTALITCLRVAEALHDHGHVVRVLVMGKRVSPQDH